MSQEVEPVEDSLEELLTSEEKDIDMLKMKIGYMTKHDREMNRKVAKSIVNEGKVFHKNFEMIRKLDQFMLTQKSSKNSTKFNFPRLMDHLRKTKKKEERGGYSTGQQSKGSRSFSAYHSFM